MKFDIFYTFLQPRANVLIDWRSVTNTDFTTEPGKTTTPRRVVTTTRGVIYHINSIILRIAHRAPFWEIQNFY